MIRNKNAHFLKTLCMSLLFLCIPFQIVAPAGDPLDVAAKYVRNLMIAGGAVLVAEIVGLLILSAKINTAEDEMETERYEEEGDGEERYESLKKKRNFLRVVRVFFRAAIPTSSVFFLYQGFQWVWEKEFQYRAKNSYFLSLDINLNRPYYVDQFFNNNKIDYTRLDNIKTAKAYFVALEAWHYGRSLYFEIKMIKHKLTILPEMRTLKLAKEYGFPGDEQELKVEIFKLKRKFERYLKILIREKGLVNELFKAPPKKIHNL